MTRRLRSLLALLVGLAAITGGCTVSTNDEPSAVGNELFEQVLTTTTTSTSTTIDDATKTATVYFLRVGDGTRLVGVPRQVDVAAGVQEILNNLFTVRPNGDEREAEEGLISAIPESAELLSAMNAPGTSRLIVDVRGLFGEQGIQGNDLRNALAQIVWTATETDQVDEVVFRNNGEPVSAIVGSGETTDQPVDSTDYRELA